MQLEFRTRRLPITLDMVVRDLTIMQMIDEIDPETHLKFLEDVQSNILDKYLNADAYIRSVLFCDMGLKYVTGDEVGFSDLIVAHVAELLPAHIETVKKLQGDGTLGSNVVSEHVGALFGCYPIDVYLIDEQSGERILVSEGEGL